MFKRLLYIISNSGRGINQDEPPAKKGQGSSEDQLHS